MTSNGIPNIYVLLTNVQASYPHLYRCPIVNGEKYSMGARLLIDPNTPNGQAALRDIQAAIHQVKDAFVTPMVFIEKNICLKDGNNLGKEEYLGYFTLNANCKEIDPPFVVAADAKTRVLEENNQIRPGSFVSAKVKIWGQENHRGRRVNAQLVAIQYTGPGTLKGVASAHTEDPIIGFDAVAPDVPQQQPVAPQTYAPQQQYAPPQQPATPQTFAPQVQVPQQQPVTPQGQAPYAGPPAAAMDFSVPAAPQKQPYDDEIPF